MEAERDSLKQALAQTDIHSPDEVERIKTEVVILSDKLKALNKNPPIRPDIKTIDTKDQIAKDIQRTYFPQQVELLKIRDEGRELDLEELVERLEAEVEELRAILMEVLMSYAEEDQEVGYVQGMNSIAAAIVYNFWLVREEFKKSDCLDNFEDFDADLEDEKLTRE